MYGNGTCFCKWTNKNQHGFYFLWVEKNWFFFFLRKKRCKCIQMIYAIKGEKRVNIGWRFLGVEEMQYYTSGGDDRGTSGATYWLF